MTAPDMSTVTQLRYGHGGRAEEFNPWEGPYEDMEQVKSWCGNRVQFVFGKLSPEHQIDCAEHGGLLAMHLGILRAAAA